MEEVVTIKTNPKRLKPLVIGNKVFRSSCDYELTSEDVKRARLELHETEDVRENALLTLKEMLSRDEMRYCTDDAYLLCFLRCKKFNCEEAYKMMHHVRSFKRDYPEVFSSLPTDLRSFLDNQLFNILPYRDEDGSLISLKKFAKWNPEKHSVYDLFRYYQPIENVILMNPCVQINKIVVIIDFEGTGSLSYVFAALRPSVIMFGIRTWQSLYPVRIKSIILVNCNKVAYIALKAVRYLLKKKIADRIIIIGSDISELHQHVNPAILPKEYGGNLDENELSMTDHIIDNLPYVKYQLSFHNTKTL